MTIRLRGGDDGDALEMDLDDSPIPPELEAQMQGMGINIAGADSVQKALMIPEEVPEGWDPDADWELRVTSRDWWKDQREMAFISTLPTFHEKFFHAVRIGAVPWVQQMLEGTGNWGGKASVADVDKNLKNWTGLHLACCRGNLRTAQLLLEMGSDPRTRDVDEGTPLHAAAAYGRDEVCKLLIQSGADINARDCGDDTPLDMAMQCKRQETARVLSGLGAVSGSGMPNEEVIRRAEWITDPLWPEGYRHGLDEDSEEVDDDDEYGNLTSSEIERRIYACSSNMTYAEKLVAQAEAIPDDQWVEEPSHSEGNITIPGWENGPIGTEPLDPDTSSGWDERVLNLKPRGNIDGPDDDFSETLLRSGPIGGGGRAGMPGQGQGQQLSQYASVSTCDDVSRDVYKGPPRKAGFSDESGISEDWSSSQAGATEGKAKKHIPKKAQKARSDEDASISEDWSSTKEQCRDVYKGPPRKAGFSDESDIREDWSSSQAGATEGKAKKHIPKKAQKARSDEDASISEDWSSTKEQSVASKSVPKKPAKAAPKNKSEEETSISEDWSSSAKVTTKKAPKSASKMPAKASSKKASSGDTSISEDWSSSEEKPSQVPKKAPKASAKQEKKKESSISDDWTSSKDD